MKYGKRSAIMVLLVIFLQIIMSCSQERFITVTLAQDHPWEIESGRRFWYTLVWNTSDGIPVKTHLSIGCRSVRVAVPLGQTVVFAAYPFGTGIPFGGASLAVDVSDRVQLTIENGLLADMLISLAKRWPEPVSRVNFHNLSDYVLAQNSSGLATDWNYLANSIVEGNLSEKKVRKLQETQIELMGLPEGRWLCEHPGFKEVFGYSENPVVIYGLFPGVVKFLNLQRGLELRIVVSQDTTTGMSGGTYWHLVRMDPLFFLSDSAYQEILEMGVNSW